MRIRKEEGEPMAMFKASVVYDQDVVNDVVEFKNTIYAPSKGIQQIMLSAVFVALGFVFVPGYIRFGCWVIAGIITIWCFTRKWRGGIRERHCLGKAFNATRSFNFQDRGFSSTDAEDPEEQLLSYKNIIAIYENQRNVFLRLRNDELLVIEKTSVQDSQGKSAVSELLDQLMQKSGVVSKPLDSSFKARMHATQEARRDYVATRPPGVSGRIANAILPGRKSSGDAERKKKQ